METVVADESSRRWHFAKWLDELSIDLFDKSSLWRKLKISQSAINIRERNKNTV